MEGGNVFWIKIENTTHQNLWNVTKDCLVGNL